MASGKKEARRDALSVLKNNLSAESLEKFKEGLKKRIQKFKEERERR